jgi:2-iminobutanoate/2-iminopropanoate deaminase
MNENELGRAKQVVMTDQAPTAIGPYSQAIVAGGFVFTAGQIPLDPSTMAVAAGGIREQAVRVMANLAAVLSAAGSSLSLVVKTTCFLSDMADFPVFNEVYAQSFPVDPPARSTVQAAKLPLGVRVEVECVALVGQPPTAAL